MARSDLVLALVEAASSRDDLLLRRTLDAMVADERGKRHHAFAEKLVAASTNRRQVRQLSARVDELAFETTPHRPLESLYLTDKVRESVSELIEEHQRVELLRSHGLEARNRVLLTGPPGNGKTSLAESLADALYVPLYIVRYEGIIANLLGDTARRISALIEQLAAVPCVLLFDEFDAVAKFRGDHNESGEIKRVVTSLLGHLDRLAPHVVLVAATNYPELLDRAIWRRFDLHIQLDPPDENLLKAWIDDFAKDNPGLMGPSAHSLTQELRGRSFSELEHFRTTVRRQRVLGLPIAAGRHVFDRALHLMQRRAIGDEVLGGTTSPDVSRAATAGSREG